MEEYRVDPTISYDVVPLPSNGIYYTNKKKSLKVTYLTAADENILTSPNLIATSGVIDELLKRKILDKDLPIEELVEDDRRAILIFLRNTAWGSEYKLTIIDPKTEKPFEHTIDLSTLKTKEFKLREDTNGEYPYFMEKSKIDITFKFMNRLDENKLIEIGDTWKKEDGIPPIETKRLEMIIKSVQGNRDPMNIMNFIKKLPIKDSQDFKRFIKDNKPGLDLTQEVKTPSGDIIQTQIGFGVEFFRPFYGI